MIFIKFILVVINIALGLVAYMFGRKEKNDSRNFMIGLSVVFMLNSVFLVV